MQCAQCQHQNHAGARFCDACGARLAVPCPACGHENRPAARFCNECGASLTTVAAAPSPPTMQPASQMDQPAPAASPPTSSFTPDAERRQLTVMFCDLADSTGLSRQLDPEDLREVIRAYQATAAAVIQRYAGYIAQYLGDGLLVYFGWPQAHEDDAQRAVHAGLDIIEAMGTLNTRLARGKGIHLAVRLGIHVGPVVIGEMGSGGRHEQLALGETPNIAARLEGMAQPNTVVISDTTLRLVGGYFTCADLGLHTLRGLTTPMQVYGVQGRSGAHTRLDAVACRGLTPLVGREQEVGMLLERWTQVQDGLEAGVLRETADQYELVGPLTSLRKEVSEIYRLKGELLLQLSADHAATAETCFQQALEVSRHQQAKSWELRAATSLARLRQQQGKCQDAYDCLPQSTTGLQRGLTRPTCKRPGRYWMHWRLTTEADYVPEPGRH